MDVHASRRMDIHGLFAQSDAGMGYALCQRQ